MHLPGRALVDAERPAHGGLDRRDVTHRDDELVGRRTSAQNVGDARGAPARATRRRAARRTGRRASAAHSSGVMSPRGRARPTRRSRARSGDRRISTVESVRRRDRLARSRPRACNGLAIRRGDRRRREALRDARRPARGRGRSSGGSVRPWNRPVAVDARSARGARTRSSVAVHRFADDREPAGAPASSCGARGSARPNRVQAHHAAASPSSSSDHDDRPRRAAAARRGRSKPNAGHQNTSLLRPRTAEHEPGEPADRQAQRVPAPQAVAAPDRGASMAT